MSDCRCLKRIVGRKISIDRSGCAVHGPNAQPVPVEQPEVASVHDAVAADIEARKVVGKERYGSLLQPNNGRDALRDAYEEALDLACYLKQALLERDA